MSPFRRRMAKNFQQRNRLVPANPPAKIPCPRPIQRINVTPSTPTASFGSLQPILGPPRYGHDRSLSYLKSLSATERLDCFSLRTTPLLQERCRRLVELDSSLTMAILEKQRPFTLISIPHVLFGEGPRAAHTTTILRPHLSSAFSPMAFYEPFFTL